MSPLKTSKPSSTISTTWTPHCATTWVSLAAFKSPTMKRIASILSMTWKKLSPQSTRRGPPSIGSKVGMGEGFGSPPFFMTPAVPSSNFSLPIA